MTFETTAWAINGALLSSSLARRALYASTGGNDGIVQKPDLKVTQLSVPGIGVQIAPGVGLVLNKYQSTTNETYVTSNPSTHIIPAEEMPGSSTSARSFIVAVVVGDPDFSQIGHPFMGSDDPPAGEEETFDYVRPMLIQVSAGATKLTGAYPNLALARIDIPANTTTITNAMITDLRSLAQPRQEQQIFPSGNLWAGAIQSDDYIASGSSYADWGNVNFKPSVKIPEWATRAIVVCSINGVWLSDTSVSVSGGVRAQLGAVNGPSTAFNTSVGGGAIRMNLMTAGEYDVSSIAGNTVILRVEGYENGPASPTLNQRLRLASGSQQIFDVRFFEE